MTLTVGIPVKDSKYLDRCLQSLLFNQNFAPSGKIIILDSSHLPAINDYKISELFAMAQFKGGPQIEYLYYPSANLPEARLKLMEIGGKGDFLFLDSDYCIQTMPTVFERSSLLEHNAFIAAQVFSPMNDKGYEGYSIRVTDPLKIERKWLRQFIPLTTSVDTKTAGTFCLYFRNPEEVARQLRILYPAFDKLAPREDMVLTNHLCQMTDKTGIIHTSFFGWHFGKTGKDTWNARTNEKLENAFDAARSDEINFLLDFLT